MYIRGLIPQNFAELAEAVLIAIVGEYDMEIPQSHVADQPTASQETGPQKKNCHSIYGKDNKSKATSSLYPSR